MSVLKKTLLLKHSTLLLVQAPRQQHIGRTLYHLEPLLTMISQTVKRSLYLNYRLNIHYPNETPLSTSDIKLLHTNICKNRLYTEIKY